MCDLRFLDLHCDLLAVDNFNVGHDGISDNLHVGAVLKHDCFHLSFNNNLSINALNECISIIWLDIIFSAEL
jgi:hypothetical protein